MFKQLFKNNPLKAEMNFFDHLEELRWHIIRSLAAIVVAGIICFIKIHFIYERIIMGPTRHDFITYRILCGIGHRLGLGDRLCLPDAPVKFQSMQLSGQFMQAFSSSFTFAFIIAAPYILYEFWRFVKPALKPGELKYTRGVVFWTSLLFFMGVAFGYFMIAPYTVNFFASYQLSESIENIITIQSYMSTLSQLVMGCGALFELPVLVYFLAKVGILTSAFLKKYRRHAFVIILVIAAFISPPDVASQFIVTLPLYLLFEVSISIAKRMEKQRAEEDAAEWS
ncbi:twin-arginine translocase subunit TatC [Compostibacter hankyongensis]|uniref:Sec-independent protein translocase protein TatC n=2 Tax=Compostibacter hankyongensis TaxID=1007089 RepID=A0ABP8FSN6_9BACT